MSHRTVWSRASPRKSSAGCANAVVLSTDTCDAHMTARHSRSWNQRGAHLVPDDASERRTFIVRSRFRASMIPIARPLLGEEELAAVREVLASGMLAQGPKVESFEKAFAKDLGRKHAVAVTNGTAALHVALLAHDIGPGQEVVIPPLTFFATASTVLLCGAKPVFVDIDRSSYNMDPTKLASVITRKTAAVMPVHLYGQTAEIDPILAAARDRGIPVIEDAAQAAGERARAVERSRWYRRSRPALRRQLDGPFVLPVHRPARRAVPTIPGRDRPGPDRGRDRLPAVVSHAVVQTEGPPGPEDPRSMSRRGGGHPGSVRAPRPPGRRTGRDRAHRSGGRGRCTGGHRQYAS